MLRSELLPSLLLTLLLLLLSAAVVVVVLLLLQVGGRRITATQCLASNNLDLRKRVLSLPGERMLISRPVMVASVKGIPDTLKKK